MNKRKQSETPRPLDLSYPLFRRPSLRGGRGKPRELSVSRLYRLNARSVRRSKRVAYMRLSGEWLERLGFLPGSRVVVVAEKGKLTLTLSELAAAPAARAARR